MGIKPRVTIAPQAFAEFEQNSSKLKAAFESSGIKKLITQAEAKLDQFRKFLRPEIQKIVAEGEILKKKLINAFAQVKIWVKKIFAQYLIFQLYLFEIPRPQIQPSNVKSFQFANAYRSHSPPALSVIV